jgi:thiamine biosynthesis lipoprotein
MRCVSRACLGIPLLSMLAACAAIDEGVTISGPTMGTTYRVRAFCERPVADLAAQIDVALESVNRDMSNYDPDSLLSRFNRSDIGEWFPVSPAVIDVVIAAQQLAAQSGGAFDVTVAPVVDLWGFGPSRVDHPRRTRPSEEEIAIARARVGYLYLDAQPSPPALRRRRDLSIDLSAIAPGYAADVLSRLLTAAGCERHMVDVGGEVYARGRKKDGSSWRIGIETPDPARPPGSAITRILRLEDMAAATSGDYRDFVEWDGQRYSHTIDARTGYPVTHALASVTVLDPSTMRADGLATLLMVLGPEAGVSFAQEAKIPALFIERTSAGFVERMTADFANYVEPS